MRNFFVEHLTDPELSINVPPERFDDVWRVRIDIAAVGGGTLGKSYENQRWIYAVYVDGELVLSGEDLHCVMPSTHVQAIATLCHFLHVMIEDEPTEIPEVLHKYSQSLRVLAGEWHGEWQ